MLVAVPAGCWRDALDACGAGRPASSTSVDIFRHLSGATGGGEPTRSCTVAALRLVVARAAGSGARKLHSMLLPELVSCMLLLLWSLCCLCGCCSASGSESKSSDCLRPAGMWLCGGLWLVLLLLERRLLLLLSRSIASDTVEAVLLVCVSLGCASSSVGAGPSEGEKGMAHHGSTCSRHSRDEVEPAGRVDGVGKMSVSSETSARDLARGVCETLHPRL